MIGCDKQLFFKAGRCKQLQNHAPSICSPRLNEVILQYLNSMYLVADSFAMLFSASIDEKRIINWQAFKGCFLLAICSLLINADKHNILI